MMTKQELLLKKYRNKISSTKGRVDKNGNPIQMRLTFEEWCSIWEAAGVLPQAPYVLSRYNDEGHYELGNVFVQHNLLNSCDAVTENTELDKKINEYCLKTGYKRRIVRAMIRRGELHL